MDTDQDTTASTRLGRFSQDQRHRRRGVSDPACRGPNSWGAGSLTPPLPISSSPLLSGPTFSRLRAIQTEVVQTAVLVALGSACRASSGHRSEPADGEHRLADGAGEARPCRLPVRLPPAVLVAVIIAADEEPHARPRPARGTEGLTGLRPSTDRRATRQPDAPRRGPRRQLDPMNRHSRARG